MVKKLVVAIIGGGGREHVLAQWYAKSKYVKKIVVIPGNPFIKYAIERQFNKPVVIYPQFKPQQKEEIIQVIKDEKVGFVDVAQDNGVEAGVADAARLMNLPTVGPNRLAGEIEWGKDFLRTHGKEWGIPQPDFTVWTDEKKAITYLTQQQDKAYFVKAAGLAEGKGALPAENRQEAIERIKELRTKFPKASQTFLLEEWVRNDDGTNGEEFSHFVLSDGKTTRFIRNAMDYKRAYDNDQGENTGSMGSNSPTTLVSPEEISYVNTIAEKLIHGLAEIGRTYQGWLYISGIKLKRKGKDIIQVIETNSRLGDPEAQVIIPAIQNDAIEVGMAVSDGKLHEQNLQLDKIIRVVVSFASKGYPGDYSAVKGKKISGIEKAQNVSGVHMYGAGVAIQGTDFIVNGGRLLYLVGEGKNVEEARKKVYKAARFLTVGEEKENGGFMRFDIGEKDMKRGAES